jgi:hypothetical protein
LLRFVGRRPARRHGSPKVPRLPPRPRAPGFPGPADHTVTAATALPGRRDAAEINDQIIDRSIFIDPETQEPLPLDQQAAQAETRIDGTYLLRKIDGVWKVAAEE